MNQTRAAMYDQPGHLTYSLLSGNWNSEIENFELGICIWVWKFKNCAGQTAAFNEWKCQINKIYERRKVNQWFFTTQYSNYFLNYCDKVEKQTTHYFKSILQWVTSGLFDQFFSFQTSFASAGVAPLADGNYGIQRGPMTSQQLTPKKFTDV